MVDSKSELNKAIQAPELAALNVVKKGSGLPPLVMLHGWGQSLGSLLALGDLLSKSRSVHLIDLPGFGGSPKPPSDWGTIDYADRILAYLHEQNLKDVDILGHSFGGRIALQMAAKEPQLIRKLVLINAAGLKRELKGKRAFKASLARTSLSVCRLLDRTFGLHTFQEWHVPSFASADYRNSGELRIIFVKTVNEDLTEIARQIAQPVLLLWGENDQEVPVEIAHRYHELIANSQLKILPGKDHFPFLNEGAHLCTYHVLKFLDQNDAVPKTHRQGEKTRV
jgi:pimeloyl-ACP methyl ester carboxylesterase